MSESKLIGTFRCITSGKQCDYSVVERSPVLLWGTPTERRAYHLYREETAPQMSNYFDAPFWMASILRISHDIPAAKHTIVAVAAMYEIVKASHRDRQYKQSEFALLQISKSTKQLLSEDKPSLVVILICCILFNTYGNLVGDLSSLAHLKAGLDIVHEISSRPEQPLVQSSTREELDMVQKLLVPIVRRLSYHFIAMDVVQAFRESLVRPLGFEQAPTLPAFSNLYAAEEFHVAFQRWVLRNLQPAMTPSGYIITTEEALRIESISVQFVDAVDHFRRQVKDTPESATLVKAALVLKANHFTFLICLKAMNFTHETQYDDLETEFSQINSCYEQYLTARDSNSEPGSDKSSRREICFGTDYALQIPMTTVASCARDPILRRQAINILGRMSLKEGFSDTSGRPLIFNTIMKIEEQGLPEIKRASDIPESNRIRLHDAVGYFDGPCKRRLRLGYMRYPYYNTQSPNVSTEEIWLHFPSDCPSFPHHHHHNNNDDDEEEEKKKVDYTPNDIESLIARELSSSTTTTTTTTGESKGEGEREEK